MPPDMLYGGSLAILKLKETIERIAPTDAPVIITGESGTGKELVAEAIHCRSLRSQFPFKKINCAAIPDSLLESELFGYEKGAFTGAQSRKVGLFESANMGTVFLDEIGDMDIRLQSKLLRILQGGDFRRVGGTEDLHVNIRIISATNQNLPDLIHKGQFREDLFYRLSVISVNTPPLREHIEDIPLLVKKFVADFCRAYNKKEPIVDEQFLDILRAQTWPGNVRELKNCIERAIIFCDGQRLGPEHLPEQYKTHLCKNDISPEHEKSSINEAYQDLQRKMIMDALSKTNGNKTQAAKLLKIPRRTLYNKLNKIGFVNDERY
jgi:transcriptional regulator with PAS, ATPase and Fis domain